MINSEPNKHQFEKQWRLYFTCGAALKRAIGHAIAAAEILIEANAQLKQLAAFDRAKKMKGGWHYAN